MKSELIEKRLTQARKSLEIASNEYERARTASASSTPGGLIGYDTAILSGTSRTRSARSDGRRHAAYAREASAQIQVTKHSDAVILLEKLLAEAIAEEARQHFTAADLAGASLVRDRFGWHKVVRVNDKSVTVETEYSWTEKIAIEKVLQRFPVEASA